MMHTLKIEPRLFSLKGFFWLCLFELLHSNSGSLSQELTVVVQAGDEARLPCRYQITSGTLKSYYIYWQKYNFDKQDLVVISYKNGEEVELEKDKSYKNRSKLEEQNLTLSIASVTVNDSGLYKCFAILETRLKGETSTRLSVIVPFSTPIILNNLSGEHCDSKNLTLMCLSHGGSSEPKMYGSINENPVNWTVTSNEIFGHFNITGTLQLNMTENILIQCSVHYLDFQVSSNYSLNMTKNCSEPTMPPLIPPFGIIISSGVILIFFLAMVMLVILQCYFHKRPTSSTTHQSLATDEMILEQSRRQTRSRLERSPL
ncbi:T-lymphocyte activation antigen CD80-like [Notechis scutatus]|uniref:T-lymphocyte activation antigen CD80-like n=1 Tax=Notechis scutatus TaxID=8663 RepID=A0A6J1TNF0_9SAUR|nr:T-lymphocyte activation antigen CD80-like [Notechis scutatus]XP_026519856.1 T-lymphocyte activation antigen CD80-like [Notechis scutatus]XP_026519857.1 T-lymphocyte activation antigen CD80-like [Notechis scutatus]